MTDDLHANWHALEGQGAITAAALKSAAARYDARSKQLTLSASRCDDPAVYREETDQAVKCSRLSATLSQAALLMENLR